MRRLPFNTKRLLLAPVVAAMVLTGADVLGGWGLFGRLGRPALAFSCVVAALVLHYIGPTVEEVRAYRDEQDAARRQQ